MDSSGIAPESSVCRTDVFLLDHEPECSSPASGSRGTRTRKRDGPAACFQSAFNYRGFSLHPRYRSAVSLASRRMTSVNNAAGVGIEPTPPGSEPSIATSSDYPAMTVSRMTRRRLRSSRIAGAGIEPAPPGSKPSIAANSDYPAMQEGRVGLEPTRGCLTNTCSAAELPTQSRVPCGNRTRLSSLEGWHLCRSAKGTCCSSKRKPWDSNPQSRFIGTPAFEAGSSSGRMTSIRQAAATGIEPVS